MSDPITAVSTTTQQRRRPARRLRRAVAVATVMAAGVGGLLATGSSVASAATTFTAHLTPANTGYLQLDVSGASTAAGAPVIDWYSNGGANQLWTFRPAGSGKYQIVNANSGQCLTTDGVAGHQLHQFPCQSGPGQLWETGLTGDPLDIVVGHNIYNPAFGLNVDVSGNNPWPGTPIDAWYPNGGANQGFAVD